MRIIAKNQFVNLFSAYTYAKLLILRIQDFFPYHLLPYLFAD